VYGLSELISNTNATYRLISDDEPGAFLMDIQAYSLPGSFSIIYVFYHLRPGNIR